MRGRYAPLIGGRYAPLRGGRYAPLMRGRYAPLIGGRYAPLMGGRYAPLMHGRYAPLMRALCPMGDVHTRACVRSFGAVANTTLLDQTSRGPLPRRGKLGTSLDAQVKICRGSLPRRGEFNLLL